MNLHTGYSAAPRTYGSMNAQRASPGIDSVVLRPLRSRGEIESILHLRSEIDLSAHNGAGSGFPLLEKKETSSGSSALSNSTETS